VYQPNMCGSYNGRTAGMCGEATIAEPWKGVSEAAMAETHKAQEGLLVRCDAHIGGETSVGTLKLDEAIKMPCGDLLASPQKKCEYVWPTRQNGDVSHLKTGDEITTHGECVQNL
jgi:hypothetical protein